MYIGTRVTRCVCEKVAQNVAQSISYEMGVFANTFSFMKINTQLLPWKQVAQ
jgi:hypothetical protein